jgi:hypothetical protein
LRGRRACCGGLSAGLRLELLALALQLRSFPIGPIGFGHLKGRGLLSFIAKFGAA